MESIDYIYYKNSKSKLHKIYKRGANLRLKTSQNNINEGSLY